MKMVSKKHLYVFIFTFLNLTCGYLAAEENLEEVTHKLSNTSVSETINPLTDDTHNISAASLTQEELNANLIENCEKGDIVEVKKLLTQKANINAKGNFLNAPLHIACFNGNVDLVTELLTWNPEINAINKWHYTALYMASGNGFDEIVQKLLDVNADTEIADSNGARPLYMASLGCHFNVVSKLVGKAVVNAKTKTGDTALHAAFQFNYVNIAELLLQNKASLSISSENGITPLNIVFSSTNQDLSLMIINADVNEDVRRSFEPFFAQTVLLVNKNINIMKALLDKGMDINIKLKNDWRPLHFACWLGCIDIIKELITRNADLKAVNITGKTPLEYLQTEKNIQEILNFIQDLAKVRGEKVISSVDDTKP